MKSRIKGRKPYVHGCHEYTEVYTEVLSYKLPYLVKKKLNFARTLQ